MRIDALYEELYPSLARYAARLLGGDADAADDVAQEAFVRLLDQPQLEDAQGARLWLFTVATNLVRDRGRTAARRQRLLQAVPVGPSAGPLPDEQAQQRERVRAVRDALAQLAERDRQLLLMREEGFRYAEIADAVGVAPGSVGTLTARALKRFREVYLGEDADDTRA